MVHLEPTLAGRWRAPRICHPLLPFCFLLLAIAPDANELEHFRSSRGGSWGARAVWIHEHHFPVDSQLQVTTTEELERQLAHAIAAPDLESFPTRSLRGAERAKVAFGICNERHVAIYQVSFASKLLVVSTGIAYVVEVVKVHSFGHVEIGVEKVNMIAAEQLGMSDQQVVRPGLSCVPSQPC